MNLKKTIPYLIAIAIFIIASLAYFNPVLKGKQLKQSDITQFTGMAKEIVDYRSNNNNKEPYWLGNAFSGMPAYQVSAYYPNDFIRYVDKVIRFLPRPADYLFLYFLSFFLLLTALNVKWRLAILGGLAFGFSTYLIIIFGAGHNAKAHAIGYMPLVIAGVVFIFKKRYLIGFILTGLAMALEVYANHLQMTYYMGFILLILGILELIEATQNKTLLTFTKQAVLIVVAMLLGIGVNATRLLATKEYAAYSTRGKTELTVNPDGSKKEISSGLDKNYITQFSYGISETFNLMVPRYMGGGTIEKLGENSEFYQVLKQQAGVKAAQDYAKQAFTYWGKQPIVEAPAYIGAVVFFLFFLGIFMVKGKWKHWLVATTVFSILMSWGKNFPLLTNFFIDYVPLYNKFRAVSSIQVIAELCVPLLGILALERFFSSKITSEEKEKAVKKAFFTAVLVVVVGVFWAFASSTFQGLRDAQYAELPELIDALIADRQSMLLTDSIRTIILILISASLLWVFLKGKIKKTPVLLALTLCVLFDLLLVDSRYVNKEDFTLARQVQKPFIASNADKQILEDKEYYRVANFTTDPLQEAKTSYFHKSIGGYHAAKMGRYQELFDHLFNSEKQNLEVLNMLNAKYLIVGADQVQLNPSANGNVWFVEQLISVENANEELQVLDTLNTKKAAVFNNYKFGSTYKVSGIPKLKKDSTATITLTTYSPNKLTYKSVATKKQFAVFSEIYYKDGWNVYVDGKKARYIQVNYVLRGMEIPAGQHLIEFKFEPTVIETGNSITLISYAFLVLLPIGWFFLKKKVK